MSKTRIRYQLCLTILIVITLIFTALPHFITAESITDFPEEVAGNVEDTEELGEGLGTSDDLLELQEAPSEDFNDAFQEDLPMPEELEENNGLKAYFLDSYGEVVKDLFPEIFPLTQEEFIFTIGNYLDGSVISNGLEEITEDEQGTTEAESDFQSLLQEIFSTSDVSSCYQLSIAENYAAAGIVDWSSIRLAITGQKLVDEQILIFSTKEAKLSLFDQNKMDQSESEVSLDIEANDFPLYVVLYKSDFANSIFQQQLTRENTPADAIYLGGAGANDENTGTTTDQPLATLEKAITVAMDKQASTIFVQGEVNLTTPVDGQNLTIKRDPNYLGYLFTVKDSVTVSLSNMIIDGNYPAVIAEKSLIAVQNGASLTIADGTILQNNQMRNKENNEKGVGSGGAISVDQAILNMTGGIIQGNVAKLGGGIYLTNQSSFNLSGGLISSNTALRGSQGFLEPSRSFYSRGGGILVGRSSTMTFSAGKIAGNNAFYGGGISLGEYIADEKQEVGGRLSMTAGEIVGNRAFYKGGGIFINCGPDEKLTGVAEISGGAINENIAHKDDGFNEPYFNGGGIYVEGETSKVGDTTIWTSTPATLYLRDALITGNKAAQLGGGIAAFPLSKTYISADNGAAIFANTAEIAGSEDFVIYGKDAPVTLNLYGRESASHSFQISDYMLGGMPYF